MFNNNFFKTFSMCIHIIKLLKKNALRCTFIYFKRIIFFNSPPNLMPFAYVPPNFFLYFLYLLILFFFFEFLNLFLTYISVPLLSQINKRFLSLTGQILIRWILNVSHTNTFVLIVA